jgi:hypothetical protein
MSKYSIKKTGGKTGLEGLTEYNMNNYEDIMNEIEFGIEGKILKKMNVKNYIVARMLPAKELNVNSFQEYIGTLKSRGIDIGKGESEYGYKMLLPKKEESYRELIIFRRKITSVEE